MGYYCTCGWGKQTYPFLLDDAAVHVAINDGEHVISHSDGNMSLVEAEFLRGHAAGRKFTLNQVKKALSDLLKFR